MPDSGPLCTFTSAVPVAEVRLLEMFEPGPVLMSHDSLPWPLTSSSVRVPETAPSP
ncbi:hypothetical protein ACFV4I_21030 [Nocardiopsis alba]|uniref:Uncharacterized protein n=2 Tax=Nocardiopsis alba TaxID=53437 RepID=A0A7K2INC0_9ACTN|nr:hypothetical protein [Nocardiopsis alba]MYR31337.1 hypothetical protein [Nocardiopsis alba]